MTIAVAVKVGDGIVLGADSASTLASNGGVVNVYFNAEKIINLVKGLPLGMVVYGLGGLDGRSVTSLAKDLRERLSGNDAHWQIDPAKFTMQQVAERVREFFYDEYYVKEYPKKSVGTGGATVDVWDQMGLMIAGFSGGAPHSELWAVEIDSKGVCPAPKLIFGEHEAGKSVWAGQPEALTRLVRGYSSQVVAGLRAAGVSDADVERFVSTLPVEPLVQPAMPLQDAIDLVKYLVDVTVGFVRFVPGAPTVAEPTDVAAVTRHEGFRWVRRKHYYSAELNPTTSGNTQSAATA